MAILLLYNLSLQVVVAIVYATHYIAPHLNAFVTLYTKQRQPHAQPFFTMECLITLGGRVILF
jgi:hypothetical protein